MNTNNKEIKVLSLSELTLDPQCQGREGLSQEAIQEYAEGYLQDPPVQFPPMKAISDGENIYLYSGFHRYNACKLAGVKKHAVEVEEVAPEDAFNEAVYRSLSENAAHGVRRTNADKRLVVERALKHPHCQGWSSRMVAEYCGVSHMSVERIRPNCNNVTVDTPRLGKDGKTRSLPKPKPSSFEEEGVAGEKSVNAAYKETQEARKKEPAEATFNRTNDNVSWAWWTWNPVTGCEHGCSYCYARDIAARFYPPEIGFTPHFYPERLGAPKNTKLPSQAEYTPEAKRVFVCSMADLFGEWVPQEWLDAVLQACREAPEWTFLFLTKNPARMVGIDWPENCWAGTTVDTQARVKPAEEAFRNVNAPVKFVSVEPFLEYLSFSDLGIFDYLILGGQSKTTQLPGFQPKWHWVQDLLLQAQAVGLGKNVFWKPNLCPQPGVPRIREAQP